MSHSICLIDDSIPLGNENLFIDDTGRLNSSNIELLLNQEDVEWEEAVKALLLKLIKDKKSWNVSAFRNPNIYLNNFDKELYLPDFIIFDWDYGKIAGSTEELLKEIIEKSFTLISIYTRSDEKESVERIIEDGFKDYRNRINLIIKSEENSPQKLIDWAKKLVDNNFAFKFSKELRDHNQSSLENILIEFAKPSINDLVWIFGEDNEIEQRSLQTKDLCLMVVEKLRDELLSKNFASDLPYVDKTYNPDSNIDLVKKMWSYRLYYKPTDNIVRKGDIIRRKNQDDKTLYLVISSDCHLKYFWQKNFGYLSIVPIYRICKENSELKNKLELYKKKTDLKKKNITPSSLTNLSNFIQGPTIIPCIPLQSGLFDYMLFPKEITNINVPVPDSKQESKRDIALIYDFMQDYEKENRISISEPFITPLVEHILYNVSGYGVPDYPNQLSNELETNLKGLFE